MRKAIYTAILGGYDDLKPIRFHTPGWDYVCFTDADLPRSHRTHGWRLERVAPDEVLGGVDPGDPARRSRHYKILVHKHLADYDLTIWHDGSMETRGDLDDLVSRYAPGSPALALMAHPKRRCVFREADACIADRRDDPPTIAHQVARYRDEGYPRDNGLFYGGFLIRRPSRELEEVMRLWWGEVVRGSRRDQLSLNYALWKHGGSLDLHVSPYDRRVFLHELRRTVHRGSVDRRSGRRRAPRT